MHVYITESLCCMAKTNTTLQINYSSKKQQQKEVWSVLRNQDELWARVGAQTDLNPTVRRQFLFESNELSHKHQTSDLEMKFQLIQTRNFAVFHKEWVEINWEAS